MRRLIVLRHAKSSWKSDVQSDHARPLNKRGKHDAPRVAARLDNLGWTPDYVLCSDARRASDTLDLMLPVFSSAPEVDYLSVLYHAGAQHVGSELARLPDEAATVMVVGHNPGWERVVEWLTDRSIMLKTCTAVLMEIEAPTWRDALTHAPTWNLHEVIYPKEL